METKKQNLMNNSDLESLMNIVNLNSNLMEATKSIKAKNNESAIKALKALKDKPAVWPELIITAFSSQNFKVVEYMFENYGIDLGGSLELSPNMISSEILQDQGPSPKNLFSEKDKEMYTSVKVPYNIIAATSGDIDIFHFVKEKGANLATTGHICLSKKQKNSVISNILGAAAYYGRSDLTDYILKKHSVEINLKCMEKKVKKKQVSNIVKEFSEMTPLLLAVVSDAPESNSIEVIKHLLDKSPNLSAVDFNKNTILHLAVKHNKLEIIKFFQDILTPFLFEANKEGQTPFAIAQESNLSEIQSFLNSIAENPNNNRNIEEELNELIESTNQQQNKKKKKGNKKNAKDEVRLLNSAGFQETLKIKQPSVASDKQKVSVPDAGQGKLENEESVDTNIHENITYIRDANKFQGKKNANYDDDHREKSRGGYAAGDYEQNDTYYNNNQRHKERGYKYNNEYTAGGEYDENYEYDNYQYDDRYGENGNYNAGYNAKYKGRYGYQNYTERGNSGRYYRNDRDFRYNNRDYVKGAKSFERTEVIEKPIKYEEKVVSTEAPVINEKEEKKLINENLDEIISANPSRENASIQEAYKEDINVKNNNEITKEHSLKENKNTPNVTPTNIIGDSKDKDKVIKEKKIVGLDAKTLKKIEKKEKKSKGLASSINQPTTRKLSKEEPTENVNEFENAKINKNDEINKEKPDDKQTNENINVNLNADIVSHAITNEEVQKPNLDIESERNQEPVNAHQTIEQNINENENKQDNNQDNYNNNEIEDLVGNEAEPETLPNTNTEKQEEIKEKPQENRDDNIFVNENLLCSREIIKKYYVEQCLKLEEHLEKEKREKELYYNALINKNLIFAKENLKSKHTSEHSHDKLEDLLHLANQELESKSKKINHVNLKI